MKEQLMAALSDEFSAEFAEQVEFSPVPRGQSGDLAVKFFALAKSEGKSPVQIAQAVKPVLDELDLVEKTEVAGPYLNIYFSAENFFADVLAAPLASPALKGQTVVVEYSSPNTNKPLHLGHMRNHALGISLANLYESCGADVKRVSIINDRGVHICKSMLAYQAFGNGETPESSAEKSDHFVGRYYVRFSTEAKKDETWNDRAQEMLVKWEQGDPETKSLWETMNQWTYDGHDATYARQGVRFDKKYYESQTYELGRDFVEKGVESGAFYRREDGAAMVDLEDEGLDKKVVLRPDGTSVYITQDLGTTFLRSQDFDFDQHVWIVGDEQNYHFKVLILCLEKLGLLNRDKLYHLGYGMVNLPDGKMKSREGTVVDADNLMDELKGLALAEISKRDRDIDEKSAEKIAEQIQDAAWKYFLLSVAPRKAMTFDKEKSIQFEGATGPYLQYAGVRIQSIFRKAMEQGIDVQTLVKGSIRNDFSRGSGIKTQNDSGSSSIGHFTAEKFLGAEEKLLGVKILAFKDMLERAVETKNPTYVVTFVTELAQDWSSYYGQNSLLNVEDENLKKARLVLAQKVYSVLEKGLQILGIQIPTAM